MKNKNTPEFIVNFLVPSYEEKYEPQFADIGIEINKHPNIPPASDSGPYGLYPYFYLNISPVNLDREEYIYIDPCNHESNRSSLISLAQKINKAFLKYRETHPTNIYYVVAIHKALRDNILETYLLNLSAMQKDYLRVETLYKLAPKKENYEITVEKFGALAMQFIRPYQLNTSSKNPWTILISEALISKIKYADLKTSWWDIIEQKLSTNDPKIIIKPFTSSSSTCLLLLDEAIEKTTGIDPKIHTSNQYQYEYDSCYFIADQYKIKEGYQADNTLIAFDVTFTDIEEFKPVAANTSESSEE